MAFCCGRTAADSAAEASEHAKASPVRMPGHSHRDDCRTAAEGRSGITFPTIPVVPCYERYASTGAVNLAAVDKVCVKRIIVQSSPESLGVLPIPVTAPGKDRLENRGERDWRDAYRLMETGFVSQNGRRS